MKRSVLKSCLLFCLLTFLCAPAFAQKTSEIIFCQSISDTLEPSGVAKSFENNVVSWFTKHDAPYGVHQLVFSIYKRQGNQESLFFRENMDINPTWAMLAMEDMPFPSEGSFLLVLEKQDGNRVGEGMVEIGKAMPVEENLADKKVLGKTLEEIFNQYRPK